MARRKKSAEGDPAGSPIETRSAPEEYHITAELPLMLGIESTVGWLVERFKDLGFVPKNVAGEPDATTMQVAVVAYQAFHGLDVDGVVGPQTINSLRQERFCGLPDVMHLAAGAPPKWLKNKIHWAWDVSSTAYLNNITNTAAQDAAVWGCKLWTDTAQIDAVYSSNKKTADVLIRTGQIDGKFGTLAWSKLPNGQRDQVLDQRYEFMEPWIFSANPPNGAIDLGRVWAHEWGHMFGIPHISNGNLMAPMYDPSITKLMAGDIHEIVSRYGNRTGQIPDPVDPPPVPPTGGKYLFEMDISGVDVKVLSARFRGV